MTFRTASDYRRALAAFACVFALVLGLTAMAGTADDTPKNGILKGNPSNKVLASEFLLLLKAKNQNGLKRFLDKAFLLQRGDGTYLNKSEYLAEPALVYSYKIRNIVATRKDNVRVIRFEAKTDQVIDGKQVPGVFIPRLSTFVKTDGKWTLISHANFLAPPAT